MANDEERKFRLRAARKPVLTKRTPGSADSILASVTPASQKSQDWRASNRWRVPGLSRRRGALRALLP
jgi:hypothetical protein